MLLTVREFNRLNPERLMEIYTDLEREEWLGYLREVFFLRPDAVYYVWEQDGQYLSALRMEEYGDGLLLQGLQTRPDRRRQGYAGTLLRAVLKTLPEGTKVYSHVAVSNRASLALHYACGFVMEKDSARLLDGTVTSRYVTMSVTV